MVISAGNYLNTNIFTNTNETIKHLCIIFTDNKKENLLIDVMA